MRHVDEMRWKCSWSQLQLSQEVAALELDEMSEEEEAQRAMMSYWKMTMIFAY